MKELTKAESQIMQILWEIKKGFINDIMEYLPEPKPAYNTVSTIVRILEKKGFVNHVSYGKSHQYYPLVKKETYTGNFIQQFTQHYFNNSFSQLVSFFTNKKEVSIQEMEEIKKIMEESIYQKQQKDTNTKSKK